MAKNSVERSVTPCFEPNLLTIPIQTPKPPAKKCNENPAEFSADSRINNKCVIIAQKIFAQINEEQTKARQKHKQGQRELAQGRLRSKVDVNALS
jgi:hypothetical protein